MSQDPVYIQQRSYIFNFREWLLVSFPSHSHTAFQLSPASSFSAELLAQMRLERMSAGTHREEPECATGRPCWEVKSTQNPKAGTETQTQHCKPEPGTLQCGIHQGFAQLLNMVEVDWSTRSESAWQIAGISINFRLN